MRRRLSDNRTLFEDRSFWSVTQQGAVRSPNRERNNYYDTEEVMIVSDDPKQSLKSVNSRLEGVQKS
jgi:hypothetical protein